MNFHWQNLNEPDPVTGRRKRGLQGRAWLGKWRLEWHMPKGNWGVSLYVNGGDSNDEVMLHLGCGLFSVYLSRYGLPLNWFGEWRQSSPDMVKRFGERWFLREERFFRIEFYEGTFRLTPWGRDDWRSKDPWWVRGISWSPVDVLLGRQKHEHRILGEQREVLIPMPEGSYLARMRPEEREWKRSRWPWWPSRILHQYIDIEIPGGIPFEGKGENSWDCGEDGLWGCSSSSFSYEKAAGHVVQSVLESRKRYGGSWIHRGRGPVMAAPKVSQ